MGRIPEWLDDDDHRIVPARQPRSLPAWYAGPPLLPGPVSDNDDIATLVAYLRVLWKQKWIVVSGVLIGTLAGLGMSLWMTPMYQASTTLEIQNVQEPLIAAALITTDPNIGTQVQLLSSDTLRQRVETQLVGAPPEQVERRDPLTPVRRFLSLPDPEKTIGWETAVYMAGGSRRVTANRDSRIVVIESRSPNPQAAAQFTNTLAQEYIAQNKEVRWESYEGTNDWLSRGQEDLKKKLEDSERRLREFARTHGLIITASQNTAEENLRQLQTELGHAAADRITKKSVYDSSLSSPTESLPEILDSGPMAQYQLQIAELRRQLAELSTTLTPDHYKTQRVQASIKELEAARDRERKNIISRIRIDHEAAERREAQLQQAFQDQARLLSGQAEHLIQYNILAREVETNKKLYDQTMAQGKEAGLASAMRRSNARVVDPAVVPMVPGSPNLRLNFSVGMAGGFFCGVLFVIVRCTLEARVQSPGGFHVNLRELGVIPSASIVRGLRNRSRLLQAAGDKTRGTGKRENTSSILTPPKKVKQVRESLELVTSTQKTSVISEAFRSAMTSILFAAETGERLKAFVLTSPAPREGKTTVSTNLAIALSEINHRVVLIDADMRLPRLHTIFDLPNTLGLSDFLHERKPLDQYPDEELVRKTHIPNLFVMPAGPARSNLPQLLYSARMKELLARLRSTFDTILLDTAPMMSVPDARILARAADAVILVIRAHQTYQESALAAIRCFEEDGCLVLGTILNDWNPRRSTYGPYGMNSSAYRIYGH